MDGEQQPGAVTDNQPPAGDNFGGSAAPAGGMVLGDDGLPMQVEENKVEEIIPPEIL